MQTVDLVIKARWVIPVEPDTKILDQHALIINNGRIVDIVTHQQADQQYIGKQIRQLTEHAIIPGMINTHCHAAMSLLRGYADDLPLMSWLQDHIWPAEAKHVGPEFVYQGSQLAAAESIRSGVTCINEMYFFPDEAGRAFAEIGLRATLGLLVIDFPTAWASSEEEYFDKALQVHDDFRNHHLISTAFAPHAPYTVSDRPLSRIGMLAEEMDIPIHMHIHETAFEVNEAIKQTGIRPLQRLQNLGLLSPRMIAVHMTQLDDTDIQLCVDSKLHITHCPESNMKLASGFTPVNKLRKAGINVSIGTDGAASNNDLDMLSEMRTAALLAKAVAQDASAIPAHEALYMATLGGAKALGIDEHTGSLAVGKSADMVAIRLNDLHTLPVYNPISQIVYAASRQNVTDVWVAGKALMQDQSLLTINESALLDNASSWKARIGGK